MVRSVTILALALTAHSVLACYTPPSSVMREHGVLVDQATTIVLVRAVESGKSCSLEVLRVIKGEAPKSLDVRCVLPDDGDWMTGFSNHNDERFWKTRVGRLGINADCTVLPPAFTPGETYLALLNIAPDTKQFEEIGDATDKWLAFVEERVDKE